MLESPLVRVCLAVKSPAIFFQAPITYRTRALPRFPKKARQKLVGELLWSKFEYLKLGRWSIFHSEACGVEKLCGWTMGVLLSPCHADDKRGWGRI